MLTVRLNDELEQKVGKVAKGLGISKSLLVRRSVEVFMRDFQSGRPAWEAGRDLFGKHGSGHGRLSIDGEAILRRGFGKRRQHAG